MRFKYSSNVIGDHGFVYKHKKSFKVLTSSKMQNFAESTSNGKGKTV